MFINGRSMNGNIILLDYGSKMYSLKYQRACMILFDFKAAFPSVGHDFMWSVLRHIGIGERWLGLIKCFYLENRQFVGSLASEHFLAQVGIRQGCPLSPLIFAAVADILL